jgi:cobalt-precorrin-5B (C1)-methyltransferase
LAPGSLGERTILNLFDIPKDQIIQMSNFVGFMLDAAKERHFKKVILAGHPGKLAKLLNGDFHTHSSVSKPANDILIDTIIQSSSVSQSDNLPETLRKTPTVEGIVDTLKSYNIVSVMNYAAEQIEAKAVTFCNGKPPLTALNIGVILFDMKGSIIGISGNALTWLNTQRKK